MNPCLFRAIQRALMLRIVGAGICLYPLFFSINAALAQNADVTLTFVARTWQLPVQGHAVSMTGHAFLIIGVKTDVGIKEEVFGFYPVSNSTHGMIKGPGMLKAEWRCGPNDDCGPRQRTALLKRLSEVKESVTIPISLDDRKTVYDEIKQWDSKNTIGSGGKQIVPSSDAEYRIFDSNCIDFIAAVASRLGYPIPERSSLQTPAQFLAAFKPMAVQELKLREARRGEAEARAQAQAAEKKARAAEARAQRAEIERQKAEEEKRDAEANSIPAGWITCTCPQVHRGLGKVVNGVLYHPADIRCPQ